MNREIKFRFWVKEAYKQDGHEGMKYKMIYPHDYKDRWYVLDLQKQVLMEGEGGSISDFPMEVMQFTGRRDINNCEIWEGDICKDQYQRNVVVKWIEELHWDGGGSSHPGFWMVHFSKLDENDCDLDYHNSFDKIEVIGNIYENPELLNDGVK